MRTILAKDNEGEVKFEIADEATITFGPDVPYAEKADYQKAYSLRVYADPGKKTLLATFSSVKWFRDLSMRVSRLVVREEGKSLWKSNEDGYETSASVRRSQHFVDAAHTLTGEVAKSKKRRK